MKAALIKETDAFGNMTYYTTIDDVFIENSLVYIGLDQTPERKKELINEAFDRYAQVQYSKGMKTKEIVIETELDNQ